jgi:hypothetical protein
LVHVPKVENPCFKVIPDDGIICRNLTIYCFNSTIKLLFFYNHNVFPNEYIFPILFTCAGKHHVYEWRKIIRTCRAILSRRKGGGSSVCLKMKLYTIFYIYLPCLSFMGRIKVLRPPSGRRRSTGPRSPLIAFLRRRPPLPDYSGYCSRPFKSDFRALNRPDRIDFDSFYGLA